MAGPEAATALPVNPGTDFARMWAVLGLNPDALPPDFLRMLTALSIQGSSPVDRALKIADALDSAPAKAAFLPRIGDMKGAIAAHRQVVDEKPHDSRIVLESLIQMIDRESDTSVASSRAIRQEWWNTYGADVPIRRGGTSRDVSRPLRVGYVSSNFKHSSAGNCLEALILKHSDDVQAICYSTCAPSQTDPMSWVFQALTQFVDVSHLSEEDFAQRIRDDQVDILVDCMGFTHGNRLRSFCEHPAPIQITGWGYATGTIQAMDYIILDGITRGDDEFFETPVNAPCVITYGLPHGVPEIAPAPSGPMTFGAFHCFIKVNDEVLRVWRRIVDAVPGSRVIFKGKEYAEPLLQERILNALGPRAEFWPQTHHLDHLASFKDIDLVLDPWPQTGGVTTCEAICMGVPSVTFLGDRTIQRAAAAILDAVGFQQGIAYTEDGYVKRAVELATTMRPWLAGQRPFWRERFMHSRIISHYVPNVVRLYRSLWRDYCLKEN